jgi:hypothetical protein
MTDEEGIFVAMSQEKLDKCQQYIGDIVDGELASLGGSTLDFKLLEHKQSFLIYLI